MLSNIKYHFTSLHWYFRVLTVLTFSYSSLTFGQTREQWVTESGTKVIFVQSVNLPMVDIVVDFSAGAAFDPPGKEGLARLTMRMLDKGTPENDEHAIAARLAATGSQMGGNFDLDRSGVSLRSLSYEETLATSVRLFTEVLSQPNFPQSVVDREKEALITSIRERNTRPASVASRALSEALFGQHPYRSSGAGTETTIQSLTVDDLVYFHERFYRASNASITIVGNLTMKSAESIARQLSENLPVGASERESLEFTTPVSSQQEIVIPHDTEQAHIRIGMVGIQRGDPDHLPLVLGNQILGGGGMTSILYDELREKRGMTYGVGSYFNPLRDPGPFVISFQTKQEQAWEALDITTEILKNFIDNGPNAKQVDQAKRYFIGAFALNVDSNGELLNYYSNINFYDLPLNYIDSFSDRVTAVTVDQIKDAIKRRMSLDKAVSVIVGPTKLLDEPNG